MITGLLFVVVVMFAGALLMYFAARISENSKKKDSEK